MFDIICYLAPQVITITAYFVKINNSGIGNTISLVPVRVAKRADSAAIHSASKISVA